VSQGRLFSDAELLISFSVAGIPLTQGSKVSRISGKRKVIDGVTWVRNPVAAMIEQSNLANKSRGKGALDAYRRRIAGKAALALPSNHVLVDFPIVLECVFVFPRKEEHYRKSGGLKSTAPLIPGNDVDKYFRAVGDSLTGIFYKDDRLITHMGGSRKRFGSTKGIGGVYVKSWRDEGTEL
jgi:Holliday junction resolvase RusA-like endonuclease